MFAILGYGEQARAIIHYLLKNTNDKILSVDIFHHDVDPLYKDRWEHLCVTNDLLDTFHTMANKCSLDDCTLVNCLPTEYIVQATAYAIDYGWNVVDLGGETEVEYEQIKLSGRATDQGSVVIRAAGLAPGIVSSFVAELYRQNPDILGIKAYCGGIPLIPEYPLGYVQSFNESGLVKEYSGLAKNIRDGNLISLPALSEREHLFVQGLGILEADITTGGLSTTPEHIDLEYLSYKTLRYPGHFNYVKNNILYQKKPEQILKGMLLPVSRENQDLIVLHIDVETLEDIETFEYFWQYDLDLDLSAMAQATGYIAAEVAIELADLDPGIYNMEVFDPFEIRNQITSSMGLGIFSKELLF